MFLGSGLGTLVLSAFDPLRLDEKNVGTRPPRPFEAASAMGQKPTPQRAVELVRLVPEADIRSVHRMATRVSNGQSPPLENLESARCLDLASTLEPVEGAPTKCGPCCADAPAGEHISRIVDAEINAADADRNRKQNRQT
jgi:hypothetical protein